MYDFHQVLKYLPALTVATVGIFLALTMLPGLGWLQKGTAGEAAVALPPPAVDLPKSSPPGLQVAVVAGGCFWGVQGVYQHVKGVTKAVSGYAGGEAATAHYDLVGSGGTGHAEAVAVTFDPAQISYGEILRIFFSVAHDPTQLDRQGPDRGTQYRSAIFVADPEQQKVALAYIAQLDGLKAFHGKIVTRIDSLKKFYPAEGYHQDYMTLHPDQPYIRFNDLPKVANLKRTFPDVYRDAPVLVADAKGR
jgi:peptide-methionine (S)-S-oxide reductase